MNGRLGAVTVLVAAATLAVACGGAGGEDGGAASPCVPLGPTAPSGPTAAATAWLDAHNEVRSGCAVPVAPAPSPSLPLLQWSTSAAAVAQAWADGCVYQHNAGRSADGVQRGENIAASSPGHWPTPAAVVGAWASEWVGYHRDTNTCTPPPAPAPQTCGHYTQLVWRGTLRVGCARATCTVNSPFGASFPTWDFFVCDYEPPGNWSGQKPY